METLNPWNGLNPLFKMLIRSKFEEARIHPFVPIDDILKLIQKEYSLLVLPDIVIIDLVES